MVQFHDKNTINSPCTRDLLTHRLVCGFCGGLRVWGEYSQTAGTAVTCVSHVTPHVLHPAGRGNRSSRPAVTVAGEGQTWPQRLWRSLSSLPLQHNDHWWCPFSLNCPWRKHSCTCLLILSVLISHLLCSSIHFHQWFSHGAQQLVAGEQRWGLGTAPGVTVPGFCVLTLLLHRFTARPRVGHSHG